MGRPSPLPSYLSVVPLRPSSHEVLSQPLGEAVAGSSVSSASRGAGVSCTPRRKLCCLGPSPRPLLRPCPCPSRSAAGGGGVGLPGGAAGWGGGEGCARAGGGGQTCGTRRAPRFPSPWLLCSFYGSSILRLNFHPHLEPIKVK